MKKNIVPIMLLSTFASGSAIAETKKWNFTGEAYGLAVNIEGLSRLGDPSKIPDQDVDLGTKDVLDMLESGIMLHHEGVYDNKWGYLVDYAFMDLGKTSGIYDDPDTSLEANIFQGVLEAKGFYRQDYNFGTIDYMAGVRWWNTSVEIDSSADLVGGFNEDYNWVDYLIGARYTTQLNNDWLFYLSADAGMSRHTKFTSAVLTGFRYQINDWSDLNVGYKSTWVDYDDDEKFAYDTATHGVIVGYGIKF